MIHSALVGVVAWASPGDGVVRCERFSDRPAATSSPTPWSADRRETGAKRSDGSPAGPGQHRLRLAAAVAGIDWSWSEHAVCAVDEDGAVERATVHHTGAGLAKLVTLLDRHRVAGVRPSAGDRPVVQALLEAGLTVFVVASRQVTALRSRYGTAGNKDDRFDAYLLADVLRTDRRRLTPVTTDSPATEGLRMLVRARRDLVAARVAAHTPRPPGRPERPDQARGGRDPQPGPAPATRSGLWTRAAMSIPGCRWCGVGNGP